MVSAEQTLMLPAKEVSCEIASHLLHILLFGTAIECCGVPLI